MLSSLHPTLAGSAAVLARSVQHRAVEGTLRGPTENPGSAPENGHARISTCCFSISDVTLSIECFVGENGGDLAWSPRLPVPALEPLAF